MKLDFINKHKGILIIVLLILLNISIRTQTYYLPITDEWARDNFDRLVYPRLSDQITKQYPNLPKDKLTALINEEYAKIKNSEEYTSNLKFISSELKKSYRNELNHTYVADIDPYYWIRFVNNILETGHIADKTVDGISYDMFRLAPKGTILSSDILHSYEMAYFHKFISLFGVTDITISIFFFPVVITCLTLIFAYLLLNRIGGWLAGTIGSLYILFNLAFLSRTAAGFADTDIQTVFMPIMITYFFIESYFSESNTKRLIMGTIAGIFMGLFAGIWAGWFFLFDIYLLFGVLISTYLIIKKDHNTLFLYTQTFLSYFLPTLFVATILRGIHVIPNAFLWVFNFLTLKNVATAKIWPNVITTVAEQADVGIDSFILFLGGKIIIGVAVLGLLFLIYKKQYVWFTLLFAWIITTLYPATRSLRYVQLLLPAVGICFALGCFYLIQEIATLTYKHLSINIKLIKLVMIIILSVLFVYPQISLAYNSTYYSIPLINDAWYISLEKINDLAPKNSIITSWWDFGHWFKAVARRPVTFDGTTQDTPQAYWVGKMLVTDDESEAIRILKMLDCSGNDVIDYLMVNESKSELDAITITNDILKNKSAAINYNSVKLSNLIDCQNPPTAYFITSGDMIPKAGVWSHFGLWDFNKAAFYKDVVSDNIPLSDLEKKYNLSKDTASKYYNEVINLGGSKNTNDWIAPWPGYASPLGQCIIKNNTFYECVNEINNEKLYFTFDATNGNFSLINTPTIINVKVVPDRISYVYNGKFYSHEYDNNTIGAAVSIMPDGSNIWSHPIIASSIFNRLYFFDGIGLPHFKKFTDRMGLNGDKVVVWEVEWQ